MKGRVTTCPACGAPVEFRNRASYVAVCEFCQSAVARGDKSPEDYGKVADLVPSDSPIQRGTTGRFHDSRFEVLGHVQYRHPAGGLWDEWYLAFGSRFGWLAYAQGQYQITFNRPLKKDAVPSYEALEVGTEFSLRDQRFVVREKAVAHALAAAGEIPWPFRPGGEHRFADLEGPDGVVASFEFGEQGTHLFIGEQVTLEDLQLDHVHSYHPDQHQARVSAVGLNCPHCGGQIELHAPDHAQRVVCQHCTSMLDATDGKLAYLKTLEKKDAHPIIPLGTAGTIQGMQLTAIGFMERYTQYAGLIYPWTEYLLFSPEHGYHWLIRSERHWSFASNVSTGDVKLSYQAAEYDNHDYKLYDRGTAITRYVLGEFYWQVEVGQAAETEDYICPPRALSVERSITTAGEEINITQTTYMTCEEVESAFELESESLTRPWGVGPSQPAPETGWGVFALWPAFVVLMIVLNSITKGTDVGVMLIAMGAVSLFPVGVMIYKYNFEVRRWKDSDYSPYASDD